MHRTSLKVGSAKQRTIWVTQRTIFQILDFLMALEAEQDQFLNWRIQRSTRTTPIIFMSTTNQGMRQLWTCLKSRSPKLSLFHCWSRYCVGSSFILRLFPKIRITSAWPMRSFLRQKGIFLNRERPSSLILVTILAKTGSTATNLRTLMASTRRFSMAMQAGKLRNSPWETYMSTLMTSWRNIRKRLIKTLLTASLRHSLSAKKSGSIQPEQLFMVGTHMQHELGLAP